MTEPKALSATVTNPRLGSLSIVEGQEFSLEVEVKSRGLTNVLAEIFFDNNYLSLNDGLLEYQLSPGGMEQTYELSWELQARQEAGQPVLIDINVRGDHGQGDSISQKCVVNLSIIKES